MIYDNLEIFINIIIKDQYIQIHVMHTIIIIIIQITNINILWKIINIPFYKN